jgi:hypothetical protein
MAKTIERWRAYYAVRELSRVMFAYGTDMAIKTQGEEMTFSARFVEGANEQEVIGRLRAYGVKNAWIERVVFEV